MRKELHLNFGNGERFIQEVMKKIVEDLKAQKAPDIYVNGTTCGILGSDKTELVSKVLD
jgi:hypothetical protein